MLVLDTDHLSEMDRGSPAGLALARRLREQSHEIVITVATIEEQLRGWLALLNRAREPQQLIEPYWRLQDRVRYFARWKILPFNSAAAAQLATLQKQKVRIGTMDLRIASIAIVHGATLLSRNVGDFAQVPGLSVEDWL